MKEFIYIYQDAKTRQELFRFRGVSIIKADKLFMEKFGYNPGTQKDKVVTLVEDVKVK